MPSSSIESKSVVSNGAAEPVTGPASPELSQTELLHPVRVRYAECDPMGVAHHASYAVWLEEARTELLRAAGGSYAAMERDGIWLVITKLEIKYRRPIFYDDLLEVRVRHVPAGRIKIRHTYEIAVRERLGQQATAENATRVDPLLPADGVCAIATSELACLGHDRAPRPLPDWLVLRENGRPIRS